MRVQSNYMDPENQRGNIPAVVRGDVTVEEWL